MQQNLVPTWTSDGVVLGRTDLHFQWTWVRPTAAIFILRLTVAIATSCFGRTCSENGDLFFGCNISAMFMLTGAPVERGASWERCSVIGPPATGCGTRTVVQDSPLGCSFWFYSVLTLPTPRKLVIFILFHFLWRVLMFSFSICNIGDNFPKRNPAKNSDGKQDESFQIKVVWFSRFCVSSCLYVLVLHKAAGWTTDCEEKKPASTAGYPHTCKESILILNS